MKLEIREVRAPDTLPLRTQVLRPGREPSEALFAGPMPPASRHFAAFEGAHIVGVGFIVPIAAPFDDAARAWMLRGMSVEPTRQNQGVGRAIVEHVLAEAARENIEVLWFNARRAAVGFYQRLGFETWGEEFQIPDVGPHTVMFGRTAQPFLPAT